MEAGPAMLFWILLAALLAMGDAPAAAERVLFDFEGEFDAASLTARDAGVRLVEGRQGVALRIDSGHRQEWPGIDLPAPGGRWDLSSWQHLALDVRNLGDRPVTVACRVDNPGADGVNHCVTGHLALEPSASGTLLVPLTRKLPEELAHRLFGMRGYPGGMDRERGVDAANIINLVVFVPRPREDHAFAIDNVRAGGVYRPATTLPADPAGFFPFIDSFGQYLHGEWPGKVHSPQEMEERGRSETLDLDEHPGPQAWNRYGGWAAGPQLEATGFFRTQKVDGRWWLVDPEGSLFWSHGVDCVHESNAVTPISDRESYFADLPADGSPLARFYGRGSWAPHGHYQGRGEYRTFNFTAANLLRKYGDDWQQEFDERTHRRLRSWGLNTIGNWSSDRISLMRRTPYVVAVHFGGRELEGSEGYWGRFRDVFDPGFEPAIRDRMAAEQGRTAGDPWCLGYFVDNEIAWGDELSLAVATLLSPPEQPAKRVLIADLRARHGTIEALNQAWGTGHESWEALLQSRQAPASPGAYDDLAAFYDKTADTYFRVIRAAVKEVAPDNLYLGCRFAWVNDRAARAAAKYCDVISYNLYRRSVADFRPPAGIDKPVILGEFHFGALDRGMFHPGLVPCASQEERAAAYYNYVRGALANPLLVGTHWFQLGDQATTGRGDGENYQIGLLDVTDTPYPETVAACREVGYGLYQHRARDE